MKLSATKLFSVMGMNKSAKMAKSAAATAVKEAPKASAADALASQNKAMVNMSEVKYANAKSQKATSDYYDPTQGW